jgi:hypothetical protein
VTGFTNQMSFLMGLGLPKHALWNPWTRKVAGVLRGAIHLVRPDGMGRTFKVLVQHKGIDHTGPLDGLAVQAVLRIDFGGSISRMIGVRTSAVIVALVV